MLVLKWTTNFLSPREALFAVWALVVLLAGVDPVVAVQLVGAGEAPAAARPGAEVGLVADVRAEVRAQVRRLLVLARALGVVALVQRAPVRVPVGVLAADAPALLALALLACSMWVEFEDECMRGCVFRLDSQRKRFPIIII